MLRKDESLCSFKLYPELKILQTWFYPGTYSSPWITVTCHVPPRGSKQLEIQHYLGLTCKLLAALPHRSTNSIHWDKGGGGGSGSSTNFHNTSGMWVCTNVSLFFTLFFWCHFANGKLTQLHMERSTVSVVSLKPKQTRLENVVKTF